MIAGHELKGCRDRGASVGELTGEDLIDLWTRCSSGIVKHGFAVEYRDLEPPRTGIFDGLTIVLDPDVGFEMQCFVLLHLFGHSVQWVAPSLEEQLVPLTTTTDKEKFIGVLREYEMEAARYGLALLHQVGVRDRDAWFGDFVATDWRYVERFYREGQIPPWEECVVRGAAALSPAPIPPLRHRRVEVRYAF